LTSSRKGAFLAAPALWAYRAFRRSGALDHPWGRKLFLASYFRYKRYFEDSFAGLVALHPNLFRGGHILDIGANVGYTTEIFSKAVDAEFRVFAFEPEEGNFQALLERFAEHPFVETLPCAVGDRDGTAELWINADHPGDHRIVTPHLRESLARVESIPARMVRIDSFAVERGISKSVRFVKIDVQGHELSVCRGMTRVLEESRPVVALEYAPDNLAKAGASVADLIDLMAEQRYVPFLIGGRGALSPTDGVALKESVTAEDYRDLLFLSEKDRALIVAES